MVSGIYHDILGSFSPYRMCFGPVFDGQHVRFPNSDCAVLAGPCHKWVGGGGHGFGGVESWIYTYTEAVFDFGTYGGSCSMFRVRVEDGVGVSL